MIKNILFDFDGVIMDSMPVRDFGFREIFKGFDEQLVEKLIEYHNINGGLSRFVKIKYFYEELLGRSIENLEINEYANRFSEIMMEELIKKKYLIEESVEFIKSNSNNYKLHIVSGSEEKELNYLCRMQGLADHFITIEGSPTPKNVLVKKYIRKNMDTAEKKTILIGDSINDYEACQDNNIAFYGFNNPELRDFSKMYIDTFKKAELT